MHLSRRNVIGNDLVIGGNVHECRNCRRAIRRRTERYLFAEKQAVKAFPRLAKAVQSEELKQAMQEHLEQTKGQVERLDRIFEILDKRSSGKTCEGMKGLVEEAQSQLEEIEKGPVLDCAIIGALQRIEHYEIAAYGTAATLAEAMGQDEVKELLGETLEEEKETDERLTEVAQTVNSDALSEGSEEEGSEAGRERKQQQWFRPALWFPRLFAVIFEVHFLPVRINQLGAEEPPLGLHCFRSWTHAPRASASTAVFSGMWSSSALLNHAQIAILRDLLLDCLEPLPEVVAARAILRLGILGCVPAESAHKKMVRRICPSSFVSADPWNQLPEQAYVRFISFQGPVKGADSRRIDQGNRRG